MLIIRHKISYGSKKDFMESRKTTSDRNQQGRHEHPLSNEISKPDKEKAIQARQEAENDINEDAELSAHSPNDDLDEGETARLGEDTSDMI